MSGKLFTANGKTQNLQEWGEELGVNWKTLWARINKGIPAEKALAADFVKGRKPRDMSKVVEKICDWCGKSFVIPQCRDWRENSCSSECKEAVRKAKSAALAESRARECRHCGTRFIVKQSQIADGVGRFCSARCAYEGHSKRFIHSEQSREKAVATWREGLEIGRFKILSGPENPLWTGGQKAAQRRSIESGAMAEYSKRYRAANPEKVREWAHRRAGRKIGRLPRGTTKKIGVAQHWKCAICKCSVKGGYHLDHIMPLALGGEHTAQNIQILCPTCNVRKSAKHPVQYMQELGFLL